MPDAFIGRDKGVIGLRFDQKWDEYPIVKIAINPAIPRADLFNLTAASATFGVPTMFIFDSG